MENDKSTRHLRNVYRCAYCGFEAPIIWVHGHGQCSNCGINIEECCSGERCKKPVNSIKKAI